MRIWLASSAIVTSRTSCERFSIDEWPRARFRKVPASASKRGTLVMKFRTSRVVLPSRVTPLST
ncbi:MAG: hypothetical protein ACYC61_03195 [Isosphaeraceae bacterium]